MRKMIGITGNVLEISDVLLSLKEKALKENTKKISKTLDLKISL